MVIEFCFSGLLPPSKKTTRKNKKKKKTSLVLLFISVLYSVRLVFDVRCCRCRCVVVVVYDEFFVEKALQNSGLMSPSKNSKFYKILCVMILRTFSPSSECFYDFY